MPDSAATWAVPTRRACAGAGTSTGRGPSSPAAGFEHHPADPPRADHWGVRREPMSYGSGTYEEVSHHPLAAATTVAEIHAFRWPSPDDYDHAPVSAALAADDGQRAIRAGYFEPFLLRGAMRGLEQSFEDLALHPEITDAILGHLFDFHHEHNRRI